MTVIESAATEERQGINEKVLNIEVLGRERDTSGLWVSYMEVEDQSDHNPNRQYIQGMIEALDVDLKRHPEWQAPRIVDGKLDYDSLNPVSAWLYGANFPCLPEWRESVPGARSLTNLYRPEATHLVGNVNKSDELLNGVEVDAATKSFFMNGIDSIAIRTRAQLLKMIARNTTSDEEMHWVSLACGAAIPVFDALGDNQTNVRVDLVDIDPYALEFAKRLALEHSLVENQDFSVLERNLIRELVVTDNLVTELGENDANLVDMMGIFEYFQPKPAAAMLGNAIKLVKPGGVLVLANMLSSRPQLDFNLRGVGWPDIYPRSLKDIADILEVAGISQDDVEVYIPQDGVYAVVEIRK